MWITLYFYWKQRPEAESDIQEDLLKEHLRE